MSHLKANRRARVYANKGGRASLGATDRLVLALVIMFEQRHLPLTRLFIFFNQCRDRAAAATQKERLDLNGAASFQFECRSVS